jgi:hypothetical protein
MAVGAAGVAVPTAAVVMFVGADARFVAANVNGPPKKPSVVFFKAKVVGLAALVKVQAICAAGKTLAAGIVSNWPTSPPKLAGLPVTAEFASVQLAEEILKEPLVFSET